ncbi:peptidylprolyl isomerase [Trinickia caryophylli]|nr:peptidylprolyl isomerase [Trinickia caryophylli]TRX20043.1 peptidylprolyl isomerase [Trinickia caryophylli]
MCKHSDEIHPTDGSRWTCSNGHVDGVEEPYRFTGPEALIREFIAEVTRRRAT